MLNFRYSHVDMYICQSIPGFSAMICLPSMKPNGPLKPAALPSFLAWSIFGHIACLDLQSSWIRSTAKRIPSSLHTGEALVRLQISSLTVRLTNRKMICRCLFCVAHPTLWTTSTTSSIFVFRSGAIFSSIFSFFPLMWRHQCFLYLS